MFSSIVLLAIVAGGISPETTVSTADQVARAARDYRITIYETFHRQRSDYDARATVAQRVLTAWQDAGCPESHGVELLEWFEAARASGTVPELPACMADLEELAQQRATAPPAPARVKLMLTPSQATPAETQIEQPITSVEPVANDRPEATTNPADSFLGGLGRSLFRATINAGETKTPVRFE